MTVSQIDSVAALVVIDMQKGIVALPTAHPIGPIVDKVAQLTRAWRARGLPVVLVNVAGGVPGRTERRYSFTPAADWAELIPELDVQPTDILVTKRQIGAFHTTGLQALLQAAGVTQVVLAGVATSSGVEATARGAYDRGYNVALVADAMTDLDAEAHDNSVARIFPKIGEVGTTDAVLALLKA